MFEGKSGRVELEGLGVRVTLPASIGMLTGLTSLVLSSNNISGGLDSSMGRLTNLNSLELASNRFTGTVPSTLFSTDIPDLPGFEPLLLVFTVQQVSIYHSSLRCSYD